MNISSNDPHLNVVGIGNAIVDVICKVGDDFLKNNALKKSGMELFLMKINLKNYYLILKLKKLFQEDQ